MTVRCPFCQLFMSGIAAPRCQQTSFSTHALKENSDDRAVRVCGCLSSICVRREKSLRSLAKAGQTRDTRTRVVKHTCASLRAEDHKSESVLEHPTLYVQSSLHFESG